MHPIHWRCHIQADLFGTRRRLFVIRDDLTKRGKGVELMRPPEFVPIPEGASYADMLAPFAEWHNEEPSFVAALLREAERVELVRPPAREPDRSAEALRHHLADMRQLVFGAKLKPLRGNNDDT